MGEISLINYNFSIRIGKEVSGIIDGQMMISVCVSVVDSDTLTHLEIEA